MTRDDLKVGGIAAVGLAAFSTLAVAVSNNLFTAVGIDISPALRFFGAMMIVFMAFSLTVLFSLLWIFARIDTPRANAGHRTTTLYVALGSMIVLMLFGAICPFVVISLIQVKASEIRPPSETRTPAELKTPPETKTAESPKPRVDLPPPQKEETTTFVACVGQYGSGCSGASVVLPCGSSVEAWASNACKRSSTSKISDTSGNACGYYRALITCTRDAP